MSEISKDFVTVVKSDVALTEDTTTYSTAFTPQKTHGRTIIQVRYSHATAGTLDEAKALTIGLGNAAGTAVVDGIVFKSYLPGSGGTEFNRGDLMAEWIIPPSVENTGLAYTVYFTMADNAGTITGKTAQVEIRMFH